MPDVAAEPLVLFQLAALLLDVLRKVRVGAPAASCFSSAPPSSPPPWASQRPMISSV
jgi:hypothetical protein